MYLSYEFFSYDGHDRYNDMETRLYLTVENEEKNYDVSSCLGIYKLTVE